MILLGPSKRVACSAAQAVAPVAIPSSIAIATRPATSIRRGCQNSAGLGARSPQAHCRDPLWPIRAERERQFCPPGSGQGAPEHRRTCAATRTRSNQGEHGLLEFDDIVAPPKTKRAQHQSLVRHGPATQVGAPSAWPQYCSPGGTLGRPGATEMVLSKPVGINQPADGAAVGIDGDRSYSRPSHARFEIHPIKNDPDNERTRFADKLALPGRCDIRSLGTFS
jgi:hypothetical protein